MVLVLGNNVSAVWAMTPYDVATMSMSDPFVDFNKKRTFFSFSLNLIDFHMRDAMHSSSCRNYSRAISIRANQLSASFFSSFFRVCS